MEIRNHTQGSGVENPLDADVLVIGAGLSGLTAAFDLTEAGRRVLLVEGSTAHGGFLTLLDRQFPTDSCGFCQILPHDPQEADACLKSILNHPGIDFLPATQVVSLAGEAGDFSVRLQRRGTGVDMDRCTHCGRCIEVCPEIYPDPVQGGVVDRRAIGYRAPMCTPSAIAVDWEHCTRCDACVSACPEDAVNLDAEAVEETRRVKAIVLATGFHLHDPSDHPEYGYGRFADVVTTLEFERLMSKSLQAGREEIVRPSDGKTPSRIAWIQCVGSREEGRDYCSSVCCMISLKEARRCRELLPQAQLEIFYMDMRTCGKGYEDYLNEAEGMGITLSRGRPGEVFLRDGDLFLQVENEDGTWREDPFDLVVLSVGFEASLETRNLSEILGISLDPDGFLEPVPGSLSRTAREGIYMAGAAAEPRDIPETVMQAHEAAALAAAHGPSELEMPAAKPAHITDPMEEDLRILVTLCDCSGTLVSSLDFEALRTGLESEPQVLEVRTESHSCHHEDLISLGEHVRESRINALVLGACTPRWMNPRLRNLISSAGLDPHLVQVVNLREQAAWAHGEGSAHATKRVESELRAAVTKCREYRPSARPSVTTSWPEVLVVGGGPAGISAALTLSGLGHPVTLMERSNELGGNLRWLHYGLDPQFQPQKLLKDMIAQIQNAPDVQILTQSEVLGATGRAGAFQVTFSKNEGETEYLSFGAIIVATGAHISSPDSFHLGEDPRILSQRDLEGALASEDLDPNALKEVVMIQCVGSRDEEHPYCSRICCSAALKNAMRLLEGNPDLRVVVFYRDLRSFGTMERYYRKAREKGALFVPFDPKDPPVVQMEEGRLSVLGYDPVLGMRVRYQPDRLVLSTGVIPDVPAGALSALGLAPDTEGFLEEVNPKFRPLDLRDGVYACGLALGPAFLGEAMAQGRGAALRASGFLAGLKRAAGHKGAQVQGARCSACGLCISACPFEARELDEELGHATVHAQLCQACGACAAVCPNDATQLIGESDRQVLSVIDALMEA